MIWLLVAGLFALALLGAPLFVVLIAAAALGYYSLGIELAVLHIDIYQISSSVVLMALPLFTFAGFVLSESRTADRLLRLSEATLGWLPGGTALMVLVVCALFTALTGGSGVTIAALGGLLLPALTKGGYPERFGTGLVTTSGSLGLLLVPAVPLLIYGIIAQQLSQQLPMPSVEIVDLYLAGVLPALLMVALLYVYSLWALRAVPLPRQSFSWPLFKAAVREARWELPLPVVVLGGVFSGWLVISEAAAVTALYVVVVQVFFYREIPLRRLPHIMRESMLMVGSILLILGVALSFSGYLVYAGIPDMLVTFMHEHVSSKLVFLVLLNLILLALGAFLDIFAALVIVVPLILPLAIGYGIDPVHLGIIFVANMQIGYFTPPVGINLFIASYRFNQPITALYVATLPFMGVLLVALALITYVPWLSLWLVR